MSQTTTQWILELVDKITGPMGKVHSSSEQAAGSVEDVGRKADETGKKVKSLSAIDLFAINDAVQNISAEFEKLNAPGAAFNAQLKELEAITGVTGDALEDLGDKGRETAKDFGGDAAAMLESYKGVLSKLGPQVAENQDALDLMGRDIATLSKTMGGDEVGAMNALTTAVLQFGSDIKDPMEMARLMTDQMNMMAAASKEGSAEVPFIQQSIKQAGTAAKNANVDFAETNAVIQALGKGAIYGSEAGVGFRNMLGKMAGADVLPKAALAKLEALGINYDLISDKTVPFVERLKELQKAQADSTLVAQMFGVENQNAVNVILNNIPFIEELNQKIRGTETATEQANIVMSSYNERMARMKAWFTDLAIGAFDVTSKMTPFVEITAGAVSTFANLANAGKGVTLLFNTLKTMPLVGSLVSAGSAVASTGFGMMTTAANVLKVAILNIPIIGWIAGIVAGLVALGAYFYNTSETFRGFLWGLWEATKTVFTGMWDFIKDVGSGIFDILKGIYNPLNWFDDDYSFAEGFKKIGDAAAKYGAEVGRAFSEGKEKGIEDYYADNPDERPFENGTAWSLDEMVGNKKVPTVVIDPTDLNNKCTGTTNSGTNKGTVSLSGSGSGGGIKSISQKIDIKNYFTVNGNASKSEFESIAEKVVRAINDKLSDSIVVANG